MTSDRYLLNVAVLQLTQTQAAKGSRIWLTFELHPLHYKHGFRYQRSRSVLLGLVHSADFETDAPVFSLTVYMKSVCDLFCGNYIFAGLVVNLLVLSVDASADA